MFRHRDLSGVVVTLFKRHPRQLETEDCYGEVDSASNKAIQPVQRTPARMRYGNNHDLIVATEVNDCVGKPMQHLPPDLMKTGIVFQP